MRPCPSGWQATIAAHDQECTVVEVGGGIRTYTAGGGDVIDGYGEAEMCAGGRGQILAPWPNRLGDGRYRWAGRTHQSALTEPEHHNAIHGLVRWAPWQVEGREAGEIRLFHRLHPQPGWLWTLDLRVTYRLVRAGLVVTTAVENRSADPAPFGLGWHPYLSAGGGLVDDRVLRFEAAAAYWTDERGLPNGRYDPAGTGADFAVGRPVGTEAVDRAYTGLTRDAAGRAVVDFAGRRLWMDEGFGYLMIYTGDTLTDPARRRRALAVEPMTAAPDFLRSGDGMRVIEPGARWQASWGIEPFVDQVDQVGAPGRRRRSHGISSTTDRSEGDPVRPRQHRRGGRG